MTAVRVRSIRKIGFAAGLLLATSTLAPSPGFASYERAKQMCMGDAMRLCSSEIPSIARITACMRRNKANVSSGCRAAMDEIEGAAAKAKPVQVAAPAAPKPSAVARTEQVAATRPPVPAGPVAQKPTVPSRVALAPVVQATTAETKPVQAVSLEQKPVVATPLESLAWSATRSAQPAPVEASPATASPLTQTTTVETKPVPSGQKPVATAPLESLAWFETKARQMAEAVPPVALIEAAPVQPLRAEPVIAAAVVQPLAAATGPLQTASAAQTPVITSPAPVALPGITTAKPVQATTAVPAPAAVAPVNAHPVTVRPAPAARPVRVAQRKTRHRHVRMAGYDHSGGDVDRAMAIALPILASVIGSW